MLDFLAGHKRADVPPGDWPSGWLNASKDVTIVHALLLAHEMDVYGLKQMFGKILKTQEVAGCVDYKRVFREAAVGGNAELGAYFAARIWANEWEMKQKIDCGRRSAFSRLRASRPRTSMRSRSRSWSTRLGKGAETTIPSGPRRRAASL